MKHIKSLFGILVVLTTILSWWVVPSLVKKMTDTANSYPLVYYSSILKELCIIDFRDSKDSFFDIKGNEYPRTAYDSLLPMLNFRQLMMNGTLPDTLEGQAIEPKTLRMKQVMFRFRPTKIYAPQPAMGVLLEAMPKRMNLVLPGDYFRMDSEITFIDSETNQVNEKKSARFTAELKRKGFTFPVKHYWGNPTTRKPYEEGYFCLDSKGEFFHLKMVNGRPFVKNTGISKDIDVEWFAMQEVSDKRFYGFLFGTKGEVGILESTDDGDYRFVKMDIRPFDLQKDQLTVMGNMLYWTVNVTDDKGCDSYGLEVQTLKSLSTYHQPKTLTLWDDLSEWLFLCRVSPDSPENAYVSLYWADLSVKALILNVILALLSFVFLQKSLPLHGRAWTAVYLLIAGLPGLLALLVLPPFEHD